MKILAFKRLILAFSLCLSLGLSGCNSSSDSSDSTSSTPSDTATDTGTGSGIENEQNVYSLEKPANLSFSPLDDEYVSEYYSFSIPANTISFIVHLYNDDSVGNDLSFGNLQDPDGNKLLLQYSKHTDCTDGYCSIMVPKRPDLAPIEGNYQVRLVSESGSPSSEALMGLTVRTGTVPSTPTITVSIFLTSSTYTADDIQDSLDLMKQIYADEGITLDIQDVEQITDPQYAVVSGNFSNAVTSQLVLNYANKWHANLFFIESFFGPYSLGIASSIPGSQGIVTNHNAALVSIEDHFIADELNVNLLGESAGHEMGHVLGMYHPSESSGTSFDLLDDTEECPISNDTNNNGKIDADECDGLGGDLLMFWTPSTSSGEIVEQHRLSDDQVEIITKNTIAQ